MDNVAGVSNSLTKLKVKSSKEAQSVKEVSLTEESIDGNKRKQLEQLLPRYAAVFSKNNEEFGSQDWVQYCFMLNHWKFLQSSAYTGCPTLDKLGRNVKLQAGAWPDCTSYGAVGTLCGPHSSGFQFLLLIHLLPLKKLTGTGAVAWTASFRISVGPEAGQFSLLCPHKITTPVLAAGQSFLGTALDGVVWCGFTQSARTHHTTIHSLPGSLRNERELGFV